MKAIITGTIGTIVSTVSSYFRPESNHVEDKLLKQVQACTYPKENANSIRQVIEKVISVYPSLEPSVFMFSEDANTKSLIELKGDIQVVYREIQYTIRMKVFVPEGYPKQKPMVRIINIDPQKLIVVPYYFPGRSSNDPNSYILKQLNSFQNWNPEYCSVVQMVAEARQLMSVEFPFAKKSYRDHKPPAKTVPGLQNTVNRKEISKLQELRVLVAQTLSVISKCPREVDLEKTQRLQTIKRILTNQTFHLRKEVTTLSQTVSKKQGLFQNSSLLDMVQVQYQSQQLLDLVCQKKALDNDLEFLEGQFAQRRIDLATFLRLVRKTQECRFTVSHGLKYTVSALLE